MTMGDDHGAHFIAVLLKVVEIRDDVIDSKHVVLGEHDACIDHKDVFTKLDDGHVLAHFTGATEGYDFHSIGHSHSVEPSCR